MQFNTTNVCWREENLFFLNAAHVFGTDKVLYYALFQSNKECITEVCDSQDVGKPCSGYCCQVQAAFWFEERTSKGSALLIS